MKPRTISTYSGLTFDFWNPDPATIKIEDIAHALALTNRYGGHTRVPYSVAEHSARCACLPDVSDSMACLLHDAAEAYIGDIPSPQKRLMWFSLDCSFISFAFVERRILGTIGTALSIPDLASRCAIAEIKRADKIMLATEIRDLMTPEWSKNNKEWLCGAEPIRQLIRPWTWKVAEQEFLAIYEELTDGKS